jgi:hypothetical protein
VAESVLFEYVAEERNQAVTASLPNFDLCIERAALSRYFNIMIIDCIMATFRWYHSERHMKNMW